MTILNHAPFTIRDSKISLLKDEDGWKRSISDAQEHLEPLSEAVGDLLQSPTKVKTKTSTKRRQGHSSRSSTVNGSEEESSEEDVIVRENAETKTPTKRHMHKSRSSIINKSGKESSEDEVITRGKKRPKGPSFSSPAKRKSQK